MTPAQVPVPKLISLNVLAQLGPAEAVVMKDKVIKALTGHPFFKNIPLEFLAAAGTNLEESVRLTDARDLSKIPDRQTHLAAVIKELTRVAFHVQLQAIDEESQLHTAGLPVTEHHPRTYRTSRGPVTILTGLEATNLEELGAVMLNADSQEAAFGYHFQYTELDPSVEENWGDDPLSPRRVCKKVVIRGLDSLRRYSFRGRALGDDGNGPWSKPVTIPVT